jgi:long-chain fatty acid transport protein
MIKRSRQMSNMMVASIVMAVFVQSGLGNGFRNPPASSSALALDGAKSVMVDDVSAISVNPANLTQVSERTVGVALTFIKADASFSSPLGIDADSRNTLKILPDIYVATPLGEGGVVFGLGITTPYGQSVEWSKGSTLPYFSEMILVDIAPTLGFKLCDSVAVGAGLDLYQSELTLKQLIPWAAVTGNPADPMGDVRLKGDDMAAGATLGLTWEVTDNQRIAVVYHSPFDIDYEGDTQISPIPAALGGVVSSKTDFETTIKFPTVASLGYALDVSETVTIGVEVEWVEFSRFDTLPIDLGANGILQATSPSGAPGFPTEIPQKWDDIWTYGLAVSWQCSDTIELRGSYRFLESPIPDMTLAPTLPDADKHTLGVGLGWQGNGQAVDVGYTYSLIDDRDITANQNPLYAGSYELDSHIMSFAYSRSL